MWKPCCPLLANTCIYCIPTCNLNITFTDIVSQKLDTYENKFNFKGSCSLCKCLFLFAIMQNMSICFKLGSNWVYVHVGCRGETDFVYTSWVVFLESRFSFCTSNKVPLPDKHRLRLIVAQISITFRDQLLPPNAIYK